MKRNDVQTTILAVGHGWQYMAADKGELQAAAKLVQVKVLGATMREPGTLRDAKRLRLHAPPPVAAAPAPFPPPRLRFSCLSLQLSAMRA